MHVRTLRLGWVRDNSGVYVDDRTYAIPDLVFISRERLNIVGEANVEAAPDLVVEILSPSTRRNDLLIKRSLYARIGVREYWLVEPATQSITVLTPDSGGYTEVSPGGAATVASLVLPDLHLTLDDVFEDVDLLPPDGNTA